MIHSICTSKQSIRLSIKITLSRRNGPLRFLKRGFLTPKGSFSCHFFLALSEVHTTLTLFQRILFTDKFWLLVLGIVSRIKFKLIFEIINRFKLITYLTVMSSYYRESPSYSRRSPPRVERQLIEEEISLKNALRSESQNRRLLDEIALLQIKLRKTDELEAKCDGLLKQNSLLAQDNDQLARELAERRYEVERLKANTAQLQERDAIKTGQLAEVNHSLQLEIELLKKERLESNKLYESHIQKLEFMLEDKIKQLDLLSVKCNELLNEKEVNEIKFEEEKNKLKNQMNRTSHEMEREIEYTKEKNSNEKYVEIETLKKNYTNQILLLEEEIGKLKGANDYKNNEFENQLADNKALRTRHEQELRLLEQDNATLREKILTLEEHNRSEVVNIEVKYKDIQKKDTTDLISGHVHEIRTLIAEIDKLNWLLREKNQEIQNLIRDKKEQKIQEEERELAFRAEIDTLKNKLDLQEEKSASENQQLNKRINSLADKLLRDSDSYSQRVSQLNNNINNLEGELKSKQNELDRTRTQFNIKSKEEQRILEETVNKLDRTRRELSDVQADFSSLQKSYEEFQNSANSQINALTKQNKELETEKEELNEKFERHADHSGDQERILRLEIEALKKNIAVLEKGLSDEQTRHSNEMNELSTNLKARVEKLQAQQKRTLTEIEESRANEIKVLTSRLEKALRDREEANRRLAEYTGMYSHVEKYFKNPVEGSIFKERGEGSILQALGRSQESSINIF